MGKFAVVTCTDGNFLIRSEHPTRDAAVMAYDDLHKALTADTATAKAVIKILDEQLDVLEGRWFDVITHEAQAQGE